MIEYVEDFSATPAWVGYTDHDMLVIRLHSLNKHPDKLREILCHEILHAVMHIYGPAVYNQDDEEFLIIALGKGWLQVCKDNPEVMEYLGGEDA